jgi:hypothetical protein
VGLGDGCGSVAGGRGGRVDGGGQRSSGGWIQGDSAGGVRTTEVAAEAALVRAACAAGVVEAAWFAREAWVVRRAWAGSAGGQEVLSALVVGSEGGSGVSGVRSARAVLAVWRAGDRRAVGVIGASEEGWGWLPKCRSHLWFQPRTDMSWPQFPRYFAPMLARVRWPIRSFSCTFERR